MGFYMKKPLVMSQGLCLWSRRAIAALVCLADKNGQLQNYRAINAMLWVIESSKLNRFLLRQEEFSLR